MNNKENIINSWDSAIHFTIDKYGTAIIRPEQIDEFELVGEKLHDWLNKFSYCRNWDVDGCLYVAKKNQLEYLEIRVQDANEEIFQANPFKRTLHDLEKYSDDELNELIKKSQDILKSRDFEKKVELARKAVDNEYPDIKLFGEACLHILKVQTPANNIAYNLAISYHQFYKNIYCGSRTKSDDEIEFFHDLEDNFDLQDYIFNNTHYDNCDSGYFYRRS